MRNDPPGRSTSSVSTSSGYADREPPRAPRHSNLCATAHSDFRYHESMYRPIAPTSAISTQITRASSIHAPGGGDAGKEIADRDDGEKHAGEPGDERRHEFPPTQRHLNGHRQCQGGQGEKDQADPQVEDQRALGPVQRDDHAVGPVGLLAGFADAFDADVPAFQGPGYFDTGGLVLPSVAGARPARRPTGCRCCRNRTASYWDRRAPRRWWRPAPATFLPDRPGRPGRWRDPCARRCRCSTRRGVSPTSIPAGLTRTFTERRFARVLSSSRRTNTTVSSVAFRSGALIGADDLASR